MALALTLLLVACAPARPQPTPAPDAAALCRQNTAALQTAVAGSVTETAGLLGLLAVRDACAQVTPEGRR